MLWKRKKVQTEMVCLVLALILALSGCGQVSSSSKPLNQSQSESSYMASVQTTITSAAENRTAVNSARPSQTTATLDKAGRYTTPKDVAAYLNDYHQLPSNFITKQKAIALGWKSELGNLWDVTDAYSIGGDIFGNLEGLLPKKSGRIWYECDVNYHGGFRVAERIIYSNDWLIYYTKDHYLTFSRLY